MKNKKSFLTLEPDMGTDSDHRPRLAMQQDIIQSRSKLLNRTDRILFELVSGGHYTNVELADLLGISESSLFYHIGRLKKILRHDFLVAFHPPRLRSIEEWKIVRMACLNSQSPATIARQTGLSLYRVRKIIADLKTRPQSKQY